MRRLALVLPLLGLLALPLNAATLEDEVEAADKARVQAMLAGDADQLARVLSDQLIYGYAEGREQSKDAFLAMVRSSNSKFKAYDYLETRITPVTSDVATKDGRVHIRSSSKDKQTDFTIRFLAIWHREAGMWRLVAYQSAKLPNPIPTEK
jgi:ketosteroid isomerase-like protein